MITLNIVLRLNWSCELLILGPEGDRRLLDIATAAASMGNIIPIIHPTPVIHRQFFYRRMIYFAAWLFARFFSGPATCQLHICVNDLPRALLKSQVYFR